MTRPQPNTRDNPRPSRGSSLSLGLLAAVFLAFGLGQILGPKLDQHQESEVKTSAWFSEETGNAGLNKISRHNQPVKNQAAASEDPLATAFARFQQEILAQTDPDKREELMTAFVASIQPAEFMALLNFLQGAEPTDLAGDVSHRLTRRWADDNPAAVAAWLPFSPGGNLGLDDLAVAWANKNLTNAMTWAQSLPDEKDRQQALETVANESVRTQPINALQLAVDLPATDSRDALIRRAAMEWVISDAACAVAWAEKISDAKLRAQVLAGEAVAWADQDPISAAQLAVTELTTGRLQEDTVVSIVQRWTQVQPVAAAAWVEHFPDGLLRLAAMENVFALWSEKDASAAQNWLSQQISQTHELL